MGNIRDQMDPLQVGGVGLALSGGGVRGLAHIGVLAEMDRKGVPIRCLSGASMGGVIAAVYASGMPSQEISRAAVELSKLRNLIRLVDLFPPRKGLIAGNRLRSLLMQFIPPDLSFHDLILPLALQSVDLRSGEEVALYDGSVLQAVLATCAFPGLMPPVEIDGRLLIDGGALNNLPVNLCRRLRPVPVVAVDVTPGPGSRSRGFELNFNSLMPDFAQVPYQAAMIMSSALKDERLRESPPDLILLPDMPPNVGVLKGFSRAREIIDSGQAAAIAAQEAVRRLAEAGVARAQPAAV
jgi:NTE family protein